MINWYTQLDWRIRYVVSGLFMLLGGTGLALAYFNDRPVSRLAIFLFLLGLALSAIGGRSDSEKKGYRI